MSGSKLPLMRKAIAVWLVENTALTFEQIAELNKQMKKNSITIKILIFIVIVAITAGAIFLVFHFLK